MNRLLLVFAGLAILSLAFAAPAPEDEKKETTEGPKAEDEKDVEGRIGFGRGPYGLGFGGGSFGSGFNRGGSFNQGASGNRYGQGGLGYNTGGSNRRVYGNKQTYGDRESFGLSSNQGGSSAFGQGSHGNRYNTQAGGASGQQYGHQGFQG